MGDLLEIEKFLSFFVKLYQSTTHPAKTLLLLSISVVKSVVLSGWCVSHICGIAKWSHQRGQISHIKRSASEPMQAGTA